ncbi:secretory subunit [Irineochytrium annulatum]|nr:secretory subunit [Irineochytrium annulatum]
MGQYVYDENGTIFNFFLLALLTIVLVPTTFSLLTAGRGESKATGDAYAEKRKRALKAKRAKEASIISPRVLFVLAGWALAAFVVYQIATTHVEEQGLWDPYEILGIDTTATKEQVTKQFRKLSRTVHPDKVPESEKEEAAAKYVEISKAYKVLTDEEARAIWDEFGHPDGKQSFSLGIALPKWLVDKKNNIFVLLVYAGVFGVGLPYWVASWWYRAKSLGLGKIMHSTMARFYKEVKDQMPAKSFLEVICKSEEVVSALRYSKSESAKLEELSTRITAECNKIGEKFDGKKKVATLEAALAQKALILLYSHMLRLRIDDEKLAEEQALVAERAVHVVPGLLQIAAARFWLSTALNAIDLSQLITQATFAPFGPISQLPHITPEVFKHFTTKKRQVRSLRELLLLEEEERHDLLRSLNEDQYKEVIAVASQYPLLRVRKALFSVIGEDAITPGSIVTLHVKIETITPEELLNEKRTGQSPELDTKPEPEEKKAQWFEKQEVAPALAPAPHFPVDRTPTWWVILADKSTNRLICLGKITDMGEPGTGGMRSARLQFQAPPKPGVWTFAVFLKCDSVIGCDGLVEAPLTVVDAPPMVEVEDDISEPDEDTIAGQMQALRSGKLAEGGGGGEGDGKRQRQENEDTSDSDDD